MYVPDIDDVVFDNEYNFGKVVRNDDLHNVVVHYDNGGTGVYCLVDTCKNYYDPLHPYENYIFEEANWLDVMSYHRYFF